MEILFSTKLLSLLKSTGIVISLSTSTLFTLVFRLAKSVFDASLDVSIPVASLKLSMEQYF